MRISYRNRSQFSFNWQTRATDFRYLAQMGEAWNVEKQKVKLMAIKLFKGPQAGPGGLEDEPKDSTGLGEGDGVC